MYNKYRYYISWFLSFLAVIACYGQPSQRISFIEDLIEIGDYETALGKINKLSKKSSVTESIVLKALESEIYYKTYRFKVSKEKYQEAKTFFFKNDTSLQGGIYLLKASKYQSDFKIFTDRFNAIFSKSQHHRYWYCEAVISKVDIWDILGYENSILKFIDEQESGFNAAANDRQKFILKCFKAKIYTKVSDFNRSKRELESLDSMRSFSNIKHSPITREYLSLKGEFEIESKSDFYCAAKYYEQAYSFPGIYSQEFLKNKYLYYTILDFKKSSNELKKQRFVREAQILAYQKVIHRDILIYEFAKAQIAHIDGNIKLSQEYQEHLDRRYIDLPPSHFLFIEKAKLRYENFLQSGRLIEALNVIIHLADSSGIEKKAPLYQKIRLEYLKHELFYGNNFTVFEKIKKEAYNDLLIKEIGYCSKENIEYLDVFAKGFKLVSKFDSSYFYANQAYLQAIKTYNSQQIEYAYYTAGMIQGSLLAGVKILYGSYLSQIENVSLKDEGSDGFKFINTIETLSEIYTTIGDFNKAKSVLSLSNYISLKVITSPFAKANYEGDIGRLYLKIGRYSKAYDLLNESISLTNYSFGQENRFKYKFLLSLSSLYNITGNFSTSSEILAQVKVIALKYYKEKSLEYTEYLKLESTYYLAIGDYSKSRQSLESALDIQKQILPNKSVELVSTMIELAYVSSFSNIDQKKIIALYESATLIIKETLGENIPLFADLLKRKGEYFSVIKEYTQSTNLLNQSLTYWNKLLGEKNTNSAEIFILLGNNYYAQNDFNKANDFYTRSYDLYRSKFSENHPKSTLSAGKLARTCYMQKKYAEALTLMERLIPIHLENKNKFFATMSFSEKSKFWNQIKDEFEFYNYLLAIRLSSNKSKVAAIYNNTLNTKALLLSNTLKIKRNILNSKDSSLIAKYNEWIQAKELLLYAYSQNKEQLQEQKLDIKSLENQIENLEKAISKKSELFSNEERIQKYKWQDVAKVLKDDEYVVEIVKIRKFNKYFIDSSMYLAMVVNSKMVSEPEYVLLDNGKELDTRYLAYYRNSVKLNTEDKYTYTKFWKPIKEKIPNNVIVYISPDGSYCQINLETAYNQGKYAIEENQFLYLTNSVDLASEYRSTKEDRNDESGKIILCGDPDFYSNKINSGAVVSLSGTEREVNEIQKIAQGSYSNRDIIVLTNEKVLEDSIKKIKSPFIFHIATHGYFKETQNSREGEFRSNPLLNSGLLLGNSGDILESQDAYVNQKSGILTAYEVSNMDFDNTKLVVLSACETGKGEVQIGEGVMGLVRAFTIAGGKAIVNSLFKVQDDATVKFMSLFYKYFIEHKNERDAMIYAKMEMKKIYPQPLNWGSFILYEAGH